MMNAQIGVPCSTSRCCPDINGCGCSCPDFSIKRHSTKPPFRVKISDCDGALDLTDQTLVVEANMWAKGKLKYAIGISDEGIVLADNIGFNQCIVGDVIVLSRVRNPEYLLITGFDEETNMIYVQRGYNGTFISSWKKGTHLKIFRLMNSPASITLNYNDITQEDGTIKKDQLTESFLVYEWGNNDTCVPGCFYLEFKLLKMNPSVTLVDTLTKDLPCGGTTSVTTTMTSTMFPPCGCQNFPVFPTATCSDIGDPFNVPPFNGPPPNVPPPQPFPPYYYGVSGYQNTPTPYNPPENNYQEGYEDIPGYIGDWYDYPAPPLCCKEDINVENIPLITTSINDVTTSLIQGPTATTTYSPYTLTPTETETLYPESASLVPGCSIGAGVAWVRRFPETSEGFVIQIFDSPSAEFDNPFV